VAELFRQFPSAGRGCGLEQLELSFQAGQSFAVAGNVQLQALYVIGPTGTIRPSMLTVFARTA